MVFQPAHFPKVLQVRLVHKSKLFRTAMQYLFKLAVLDYKCLHGTTQSYIAAELLILGRFQGSETAALHFLIISDCPSHTAVHCRRSGLSCCRCPYLQQSASTRHVRTLYVCFPKTTEGFPVQAFISLNLLPQLL